MSRLIFKRRISHEENHEIDLVEINFLISGSYYRGDQSDRKRAKLVTLYDKFVILSEREESERIP
jgi:hypothetical protein